MTRRAKLLGTAGIAAVAASLLLTTAAPAITADLAKKCRDLAIKAHPPAIAGSKGGTSRAERDYFSACVARGGNHFRVTVQ